MNRQEFERAQLAQKRLLSLTKTLDGVKGVGIGLTASRNGYALEVLVDADQSVVGIPESIDDVPVVFTTVGKIAAY